MPDATFVVDALPPGRRMGPLSESLQHAFRVGPWLEAEQAAGADE
jgi:hypothetical protein